MKYFAYGSNLDPDQMKERCPGSTFVCKAMLRDHMLAFTRESKRRKGGVADVVPQVGTDVWGVVYEITEADLEVLDQCEVYNQPGKRDRYKRVTMTVYLEGDDSSPEEVLIYIAVQQSNPPLPHWTYLCPILQGARH